MFDLSFDSANQLYGWSNVLLIIGAVAVLAGTIGVIWATGIRDRYADQRISKNEADTALAKSAAAHANGEAAKANERAEQARARSAEANEKTAAINERALKLESNNLALRSQVANAETQLAKVTIQQMPRSQRIPSDRVLSILKTAPPGKAIIRYQKADPGSENFASALNMRLRDAGWQILGLNGIPSTTELGASDSDIHLLMRDPAVWNSDSIQALIRVFDEGAITVIGLGDPNLPDDTTLIMIQPR